MDSKDYFSDPTGSWSIGSFQTISPANNFDNFGVLRPESTAADGLTPESGQNNGDLGPLGPLDMSKFSFQSDPGRYVQGDLTSQQGSCAGWPSFDTFFNRPEPQEDSQVEMSLDPEPMPNDSDMYALEGVAQKPMKRKQLAKKPRIKPNKPRVAINKKTKVTLGKRAPRRQAMVKESLALQEESRSEGISFEEFCRSLEPQKEAKIVESRNTVQADPDTYAEGGSKSEFRAENQFSSFLLSQEETQSHNPNQSEPEMYEEGEESQFEETSKEEFSRHEKKAKDSARRYVSRSEEDSSEYQFGRPRSADIFRQEREVPLVKPKVKLRKTIKCKTQTKKHKGKPKKPKMALKRKAAVTIRKKVPIRKAKTVLRSTMKRSMEAVAGTQGRSWLSRWLWPSGTRMNSKSG